MEGAVADGDEAALAGDRDERGAAEERPVRQVMPSGSTACPSATTTCQSPTSKVSEPGGGAASLGGGAEGDTIVERQKNFRTRGFAEEAARDCEER